MTDDLFFAGIDCGATKVMVQSATLDKRSNRMIPDDLQKEYFYSDHEMWNDDFNPKPVSEQKIDYLDDIFFEILEIFLDAVFLLMAPDLATCIRID